MEHGGITTVQEYYNQVILKNTDKWDNLRESYGFPNIHYNKKVLFLEFVRVSQNTTIMILILPMLYYRWQNKTW